MKKILTNRKGVTILEGLIALGLLALVAAGTFGLLLSVSHKSTTPDLREEMALAIEKANDLLQMYALQWDDPDTPIEDNSGIPQGLCGDMTAGPVDITPLKTGDHNISCLLPVICDPDNSSFTYTVLAPVEVRNIGRAVQKNYDEPFGTNNLVFYKRKIQFDITCNGFVL